MSRLSRRSIVKGTAGFALAYPQLLGAGLAEDIEPIHSPLRALAEMVPLRDGDVPGETFPFTSFVDRAAAIAVVGPEAGYLERSAFTLHAETYIPSTISWESVPEGWETFLGFSPTIIETVLAQPQAGEGFQLLSGTFDRDHLVRTWEASGFVLDAEGSGVWTFTGSDDDWYAALEQAGLDPLLSRLDRALALPYDNVVALGEPELLERCVAVVGKYDQAMTADGPPGRFVRTDHAAVTEAVMVSGQRFLNAGFATHPGLTADQRAEAMDFEADLLDEYGPTPVANGVMLAATAGAPYLRSNLEGLPTSPATYVAVVDPIESDEAPVLLEMAIARFEQHLSVVRREPFTDFLEMTSATVEPIGTVRLEFRQVGADRYDLIDMLGANDLSFLQHEGAR